MAGWAAAAAGVYTAGSVLLFGVRSRRHKAATGSAGFAGMRSRTPAARAAGVSLAGALILGMVAPATAAARAAPPRPGGWPEPARWAGVALAVAGLGLSWRAQHDMGRSWRIGVDPDERTDLITGGVFGSVRNPIFTGMIAAQLGTVLMAPTRLGALGVALLVGACQLQVRQVEEPYLAVQHGETYTRYAAGAGRFLPGLGRLGSAASSEGQS